MSTINNSLRSIRSDVNWLLNTEEMWRQASGSPYRRWEFSSAVWIGHYPHKRRGLDNKTRQRAFERWKVRAQQENLLLPPETESEKAAGYVLDLERLQARLAEALGRKAELECRKRQLDGTDYKRTLSTDDAAEALGVSRTRINSWIKKGAPASKRKHKGNAGFKYRVSVAELEDWLDEQWRTMPPRNRPKVGPHIPERHDIEKALDDAGRVAWMAYTLLIKRGFRMEKSTFYARIAKYGLRIENSRAGLLVTADEIRGAMKQANDVMAHAARILGCSDTALRNAMKRLGILGEFNVTREKIRLTKAQLCAALKKNAWGIGATADSLGISPQAVTNRAKKYGLLERARQERAKAREAGWKRDHKLILKALKKGEKEGWTKKAVREASGLTEGRAYQVMRRYGLYERFHALARATGKNRNDHTPEGNREFDPNAKYIPFWMDSLKKLAAEAESDKAVAKQLKVSTASVSSWLSGRWVPSYKMIARIQEAAGREMPDWHSALLEIHAQEGTPPKTAKRIGLSRAHTTNMLSGRARPREDTMQRILEAVGRNYLVINRRRKRKPRRSK